MLAAVAWIAVGVLLLTPFWGCCCSGGGGGSCCVSAIVGGCAGSSGSTLGSGISVAFVQGGVTVGTASTDSTGVTTPAVCLATAATTVTVTSPPARFAGASASYTAAQVGAKCGVASYLGLGLPAASGYSCYCGQLDGIPTADTLFLTDSFYSVTVTLTRTGSNAGGGIWTGSATVGMNACGGFGGCSAAPVTINYTYWQDPGNIFQPPFCAIAASPASTPVGSCSVAGATCLPTVTSPAPGLVLTGTTGASTLYRFNNAGSCDTGTSTFTITE